jgi:hypothetical protein
MRQFIKLLLIIIILGCTIACHQEEDDLFTTATVAITTDAAETLERVQGQAVFTNINSRRETTSANFNGTTISVKLLRGPYLISIEGVLSYYDTGNNLVMRQFRAQTDYAELMDKTTNIVTLKAILLD